MSVNRVVYQAQKKDKKLNPIRYCDRWILLATMALSIFGCVMIVSATMGTAAGSFKLLFSTIMKQVVFIVFGYGLMFSSNKWFKVSLLDKEMFLRTLILMMAILLFLPLLYTDSNGAHAWIPLGFASIQPSEFAKVGVIMLIACYLGDKDKSSFVHFKTMFNTCGFLVLFFTAVVVFAQGDFGSGMVMFCIAYICVLVPNSKRLSNVQRTMKIAIVFAMIAVIVILILPIGETIVDGFFFLKEYQKARIFSARNPFVDQYNTGYQLINGLVAFASGGFFGNGFGNSVRKFTNFPAANTDYILSIVVEEMGFLAYVFVFMLYAVIIFQLFNYAKKMKNEKGRIILVGMAAYIFIHFLFNVGGVTGLIPLTGVPLLLLSSGGSSAAAVLLGLGIAQAVISQYRMGVIK